MRTNTYIIETISTSPEAYEQMGPTLVLRYNFNIAPKKPNNKSERLIRSQPVKA